MAEQTFRLTARDHAILGDLAECMTLSMLQIHRRHFPHDATQKSCLRRLRYLTSGSLVAPVEVTACFGPRSSRHVIYRLLPLGAEVVSRTNGAPARLLKTDPKAETLLHRVQVSRVILAVNDGAAHAGMAKPLWLLEHDRWPDAARDVPEPKQYRLALDFLPVEIAPGQPTEQYGVPRYDDPAVTLVKARPDAACLLNLAPTSRPVVLFCEVDLGTETHGQLLSKLPGYHALISKGAHVRPWLGLTDVGAMVPRVLFIFASATRRANVLDRLTSDPTVLWRRPFPYRPSPADIERSQLFLEQHFRFGVADDLDDTSLMTKHVWQTLRRRTVAQQLAIAARPLSD